MEFQCCRCTCMPKYMVHLFSLGTQDANPIQVHCTSYDLTLHGASLCVSFGPELSAITRLWHLSATWHHSFSSAILCCLGIPSNICSLCYQIPSGFPTLLCFRWPLPFVSFSLLPIPFVITRLASLRSPHTFPLMFVPTFARLSTLRPVTCFKLCHKSPKTAMRCPYNRVSCIWFFLTFETVSGTSIHSRHTCVQFSVYFGTAWAVCWYHIPVGAFLHLLPLFIFSIVFPCSFVVLRYRCA